MYFIFIVLVRRGGIYNRTGLYCFDANKSFSATETILGGKRAMGIDRRKGWIDTQRRLWGFEGNSRPPARTHICTAHKQLVAPTNIKGHSALCDCCTHSIIIKHNWNKYKEFRDARARMSPSTNATQSISTIPPFPPFPPAELRQYLPSVLLPAVAESRTLQSQYDLL